MNIKQPSVRGNASYPWYSYHAIEHRNSKLGQYMQEREIKTRHIINDLYRVGAGVGYYFRPSEGVWASSASSPIGVWSRALEALQMYHLKP